jgi:hypothetical protein
MNLFVEYLPQMISETFTLSLLTAVLLKGILEIVVAAKNRVKGRFRATASTPIGQSGSRNHALARLFGSKFLVLDAVHLVFGHRVTLGGFRHAGERLMRSGPLWENRTCAHAVMLERAPSTVS